VEGGSTISQQLVKISYLDPERTFRRKVHEAMLTWELPKFDKIPTERGRSAWRDPVRSIS